MADAQFINQVTSTLTLLSHFFIIALVSMLTLTSFFVLREGPSIDLLRFINKEVPKLMLLVVFFAAASSLYYSEVLGYLPCKLCWYQRIFLYPQILILTMGLINKDKQVINYSIMLSIIGAFVALDHYILQFSSISFIPCSSEIVSCSKRYVFEYGYITFPLMSLSAFALIILFGLIGRMRFKKS